MRVAPRPTIKSLLKPIAVAASHDSDSDDDLVHIDKELENVSLEEQKSTLQRMYADGSISLEKYVLLDGPNFYDRGSFFSAMGFAPSSYGAASMRNDFEEFRRLVKHYTEVDGEIDRYIKDINKYEGKIRRITREKIPNLLAQLNPDECTVAALRRNPEMVRLRQKYTVAKRSNKSSLAALTSLQERSMVLKELAIEYKNRLNIEGALKASDEIAKRVSDKLGTATRANERVQKTRQQISLQTETLRALTESRDEAALAKDEMSIDDEFERAILAALAPRSSSSVRVESKPFVRATREMDDVLE